MAKDTMSLWRRFVNWIFPPEEPIARPADKFDVEAIAKELRLREEGRRLAQAGPSAVLASGFEAAIAARVDKGRQLRSEDAENRLANLMTELAQQHIPTLVDGALQLDKEFCRRVDAYLDQQRP